MDASQVSNVCLKSAQRYYDFIAAKRNGGVDEININAIEMSKDIDSSFKLKVSKKLFELDAISFQLQTPGEDWRIFSEKEIKIVLYDNEKNILIVKATGEVADLLSKFDPKYWKLISDLKFLIQRVIDWYEHNGNQLKFIEGRRSSSLSFDTGVIFQGSDPSDEQLKALELIFNSPISYIWGAPGTGKTRFVLSYALLTYIKNDNKVLILAPTNVALEQIFSGIIEATEKAGIDKKKLLRLGYPTKKFASEHGETCEIIGLEKQISQLKKQIEIISAVLNIDSDETIKLKEIITQIQKRDINKDEIERLQEELEKLNAAIKKADKNTELLEVNLKRIALEKQEIVSKKHALSTKLLSVFSNKVNYDEVLNDLISNETDHKEKIDKINNARIKVNDKKSSIIDAIKIVKENDEFYSSQIKVSFEEAGLNKDNLTIDVITKQLDKLSKEQESYVQIADEYKGIDQLILENKLTTFKNELAKLSEYSLDKRMETANVVGATLDTYLFRFKEKELNVDHTFVDEAGYASLIKSLTAYKGDNPITLLGDHKQLPPVSEISRGDIEKNDENSDAFVWDQSSIYVEELWSSNDKSEALQQYLSGSFPKFDSLKKISLTKGYRFGKNLADTLQKYVYKEDGFSSQLDYDTEVVVYDADNPPGARFKGKDKRANEAEAQCIESIVKTKLTSDEGYAILAPYRAQVSRLKKNLPELIEQGRLLTVHKSQGQEWDTVIFSVCDIGNGCRPWFTDTISVISNGLSNVNTAVSRAKKRLILVCSAQQWVEKEDQLISGLIRAGNTRQIFNADTSSFSHKSKNENSAAESKANTKATKQSSNKSNTSGKKEWESKLLFWSSEKKPGYRWAPKKQAWWKRKD